ncbi:M81 family metallopeptidase [Mesorhizobium sp. B2-4-2]|uniref:M81 family metallopeptidase n=1 Tax=unclassified Mesorhizobium TaxID=325217 RepID=UPI001127D293|nr:MULTISPECIES: M81 family metallopeptidase [unclassified Mesorhizobium]TPL61250.1 M81 family metallopeptidase [Mesorhizobium sp. B2-4-2]TPN51221.1 M81 family metallopeptidase [Mesorhizobium sp. B1-1-4]
MTFNVLTCEFMHESNTFSRFRTDLPQFQVDTLLLGDDAIRARRNANTELAGFMDVAEPAGWNVIHAISAHAVPGGRVTKAAYDHIAGIILEAARSNKSRLDGVLLGLHGSMVPEFCPDGEGYLLGLLRAELGADIPVAVTLDLHAMVSEDMVRDAQILVSYKTYPHVDMREIGAHAARILDRAMKGEIAPRTVRAHVPMLDEANSGRTDIPETLALYDRAREAEAEGLLAVSVNAAFTGADVSCVGPTVLATYDSRDPGAKPAAMRVTEELADRIWQGRTRKRNVFIEVDEAAAEAHAWRGDKPLVIADYADNPGAGSYGDSTALLKGLLDAGVKGAVLAPMIDPQAANELHRHRQGETVTVTIGGKGDANFGGGPLTVTGVLTRLSDGAYVGDGPIQGGLTHSFGPTAVIDVDGIEVLVVSEAQQMVDLQQLRAFGIEPTARRVLVLKSMQHFRAAFEPISGKVIVCDAGALATPRAERRPYIHAPRPLWPLDKDFERFVRPLVDTF